MTSKELEITRYIYAAIARLMPSQGRDYTVDISFENGTPKVKMHGTNKYGSMFAEHCMNNMQATITELTREHGGG